MGPAPTDPGRLWSATDGKPAAAKASSAAAWISDGTMPGYRVIGTGPGVAVPRLPAEVEIGLDPSECREHVLERPAGVPLGRPRVEVGGRAADREAGQP